ncbi:extracellular solute-binding protein [Paenibacillus contaminans]|uniref:ABC transporter substrate-binding protein n=1 Tax=Paenibacillus contaminans TaxID=450362 RepID=A0A329LRH2_9BACL|nr:extracellular solute-binding protein [Paenibacillus contaminans]RAV09760.1 ABC transporter substrate-binding protein [Paenibacillus contaminans]
MKRPIIAALSLNLSASLLLSACGSNTEKQKAGSAPAAEIMQTLPAKYDPPIELTTGSYYFSGIKYPQGDDMNNNVWTRTLESEFGIKVKHVWAVHYNDYEKKMNLTLASGDLPDIFLVTPAQFKQLHESGLIEDLTGIYEKLAPDSVRKVLKEAGDEVMEAAMIDGKLMGIPFTGLAEESVPVLWVRTDWLRSLNLPEPKTMADLQTIIEAFTKQDPDGNGKDDTIGFGIDKDLSAANGFMNAYHAYRGIWVKDASGKLTFGSIQPEMKKALAALQTMYKTGLLDKEFGVKNATQMTQNVTMGKAGVYFGSMNSGIIPLGRSRDKDPNADWQAYPMPSIDGEAVMYQHDLNIYGGFWVVKKGVKHQEAIFTLLQKWLDTFYFNTSDDLFAKLNEAPDNNTLWMYAPIKMYRSEKNVSVYRNIKPLLEGGGGDKSKLTPEERKVYDSIQKYQNGDGRFWGENASFGLNGGGKVVDQIIKNNQFMPNQFITAPLQVMTDKMPQLVKLEAEAFTKIIQGAPIEEFEHFVADWKKTGGDEITKAVNDWYTKK